MKAASVVRRVPRRAAPPLLLIAVLVAAGMLQFADANPAASQTTKLWAWGASEGPGLDPNSHVWTERDAIQVRLVAQEGSYFGGGGSIPVISVQALHYKERLFVRVEWDDATEDASTLKVEQFADGVALEFPAKSANSVPSICMGQANAGVNIWHWRADSQAGPRDPAELYTGTLTDGYPAEFYTAREAGNPYSQPDAGPVQNLVAHAFGTLAKSQVQDIQGHGVYQEGKWAVVFSRDFAGSDGGLVSFKGTTKTDMAFAVWNGSEGDRNGQKSISQFVTLSITDVGGGGEGVNTWAIWIGAALLLGFVGLGFGLAAIGVSQRVR